MWFPHRQNNVKVFLSSFSCTIMNRGINIENEIIYHSNFIKVLTDVAPVFSICKVHVPKIMIHFDEDFSRLSTFLSLG